MKNIDTAGSAFQKLANTIKALRDPESGCPWDLKQTHDSLKQYLIEEAYELLDAIDHDRASVKEELGDVLLQILLHSQIAADAASFSITDVVESLNQKLIDRHPHVFGDTHCTDADDVARSWERSKQKEARGLLEGLPEGLPALLKAHLIGERTARVGFDWATTGDVVEKVREEVEEYIQAVNGNEPGDNSEEEFGDLLFSLAQLGRKQAFNSEEVLRKACTKFISRFQFMESQAEKPLSELNAADLQVLWQRAKGQELEDKK